MARVRRSRSQHATPRSNLLDHARAVQKKKKPYKIVLEAVTQEKKKLHSNVTFAADAPPTFGFIPAGHPEFTEWCKEQCRVRNMDVLIVSAKPKNKMHTDPEKLSHHVHRVGHHFPLEIIALACNKFGYTYTEEQGLRKNKGSDWIEQQVQDYSSRQKRHGHSQSAVETKNYILGAVREMFPKIPEADSSSIVNHAFQEGTNRVGNAKELPLARRVQLAVVAHIRHIYTDYDKLLKTDGWMNARGAVEHVSLAKLKEWRDETGEQSNEIEETFREIIVLDDDEDSSSDDDSFPDEREQSMEIVSSRVHARDLQPERYIDHPAVVGIDHRRRVPSRTSIVGRHPESPRSNLVTQSLRPAPDYPSRPFDHMPQHAQRSREEAFPSPHNISKDPRSRPTGSQLISRSTQPIMREINGRLYELQPIVEQPDRSRVEFGPPLPNPPRHAQQGHVHAPPRPHPLDRTAHSTRALEQDVVLPSVEGEVVDLTSPRRVQNSERPPQPYDSVSNGYVGMQSPKRKAYPALHDDRETYFEPNFKRVRPVYHDNDVHYRPYPPQGVPSQSSPYQSMESRIQPGARPLQQVINLTTSPLRPPTNGNSRHLVSARPYLAPESNHAYVNAASRRSPVRETRSAHYDFPAAGSSHAYSHDPRPYEPRTLPAREQVLLRDDRQRPPVEEQGARYLRNGARYGGH